MSERPTAASGCMEHKTLSYDKDSRTIICLVCEMEQTVADLTRKLSAAQEVIKGYERDLGLAEGEST